VRAPESPRCWPQGGCRQRCAPGLGPSRRRRRRRSTGCVLEVLGETDLVLRRSRDDWAVVKERDDLETGAPRNLEGSPPVPDAAPFVGDAGRVRRSTARERWPSAPAMCSPTAEAMAPLDPPICWTCTGRERTTMVAVATRFRCTTGCSGDSSSTRPTLPEPLKLTIRPRPSAVGAAVPATEPGTEGQNEQRPGSAWSSDRTAQRQVLLGVHA
jgi:hypothetical protein